MPRNEDQTRADLINPKLDALGWNQDLIQIEKTPGGADIINGRPIPRAGRTDYRLCVRVGESKQLVPIALLEAKRENVYPSLGIQQAKRDGKLHHVPFVFTTNGELYAEYGEDTQQIKNQNLRLENFPTPEQLRARWETWKQISLDAFHARPLLEPYKGGKEARYYFQDSALRAVFEKIARGGGGANRVLLSMATGTGKTVLAAQLLYRFQMAGQLTRALFVCDRDELRTQAMLKMFAVFSDNAQIVTTSDPQKNARVLIASYQTLNIADENDEPRFWRENYPPNFFSHIIIDEAHRSAWKKWSVVLTDNPDAVHIGLTATPRIIVGGKPDSEKRLADEAITNNNLQYFGAPVYEYSIGDGQEDGYLAQTEVIRRVVDLDATTLTRQDIVAHSGRDAYTGRTVKPNEIQEKYTSKQYDEKLLLDDRVKAMCADLFHLLLDTGGAHQKTIVFCVSDTHANRVAIALNNLYAQWCQENGAAPREWYAFQCTGNPDLRPPASDLISDFRSASMSHYIATTVDLLSTGVDIPNLANVVFFQYLESPIEFYQRVGRGTRTGEPRGSKLMFRLYDYTNVTRLFGAPFVSRDRPTQAEGGDGGDARPRQKTIRILQNEFTVTVQAQGRSILVNERMVAEEEYKQLLAARVTELAPSPDALREQWADPSARRVFLNQLPGGELAARLVRNLNDQEQCDLYDVLAELTYGMAAKSREERAAAFSYKQRQWLRQFPDQTANVLVALVRQFGRGGIDELETEAIWDVREVKDAVRSAGGFERVSREARAAYLAASANQTDLITETKKRLLAP